MMYNQAFVYIIFPYFVSYTHTHTYMYIPQERMIFDGKKWIENEK